MVNQAELDRERGIVRRFLLDRSDCLKSCIASVRLLRLDEPTRELMEGQINHWRSALAEVQFLLAMNETRKE